MIKATPAHIALLSCEDRANNLNYSLLAVRHLVDEYIFDSPTAPAKSESACMYAYALAALLDCTVKELEALRSGLDIISDAMYTDNQSRN